ncbi:hypothetical protein QR680_007548 [Steinernema hermaphroditum]|uniref:Armadillo repeat-containing domain-containing protein n=1 Tax=Steinernema hermaphroditum TaxID=289476 RepID=A0AA39IFP2_9BILA|nr:hypothetical protein QR680_007548 [Steinernema hermaphroditum]
MMRRSLSPTTTPTPTLVERFKADPTNISLLEEVVRATRLEGVRFAMNCSDLYIVLATNLMRDVETCGFLCGRESLHLREQYLKALSNCCYQNPRVKEALVANGKFMEIIGGMLDSNFELAADLCELIRNLAFNIDSVYHFGLVPIVPKLCQTMVTVERAWREAGTPWHELAFKNSLNALWNLATHSKHNRNALCENHLALKVVIFGMATSCHEEASGLLRCIRGTMFSRYDQLQQCLGESYLVDYLLSLLFSDNSKSVENSLLLLKDFIPLEHGIVEYLRTRRTDVVDQLRRILCNTWSFKISSTARSILEEQIGQENCEFLEEEEAETVLDDPYLMEEDDYLFDLNHPPLPDPLTPAANYQYPQVTFEPIELPPLDLCTPKRTR